MVSIAAMEDRTRRIERALSTAIDRATDDNAPAGLSGAVRHAVFPGGARIRPRLCLMVATACGDPNPGLSDAAAAAIELLHCASLVHDDLPCFDNASLRRGRPSVHQAFGQPLAVLAGDTLIVLAFDALGRAATAAPDRFSRLLLTLSRAVLPPHGIVAGQAWESEPLIPVVAYRRAKTGALFEAAALAGAISAGNDGAAFRRLGQLIGEAYQVADDIQDVAGDPVELGKPVGRDARFGRPNAANHLGLRGSRHLLEQLMQDTLAAIPSCRREDELRAWVMATAGTLLRTGREPYEANASPAGAE
jgi:geranylgeranyl diphosphate synthase, type II